MCRLRDIAAAIAAEFLRFGKKSSNYFENALKFTDEATIMAARIIAYRLIKRNGGGAFEREAGEKEGAVRGIKAQAAAPVRHRIPYDAWGKGKENYEAK